MICSPICLYLAVLILCGCFREILEHGVITDHRMRDEKSFRKHLTAHVNNEDEVDEAPGAWTPCSEVGSKATWAIELTPCALFPWATVPFTGLMLAFLH